MIKRHGNLVRLSALVALTLLSGILHGRLTNRWGAPAAMSQAAEKLEGLPPQLGSWEQTRQEQLDAFSAKMLACAGSVLRTYRDRHTGATVHLILLVGPPGPISLHPPEICYTRADYVATGKSGSITVYLPDRSEHHFRWVEFRDTDVQSQTVRVYYAWSTGAGWSVPDNPRFELAKYAYLYKLQLLVPAESQQLGAGHIDTGFLEQLLAGLQVHLVPARSR